MIEIKQKNTNYEGCLFCGEPLVSFPNPIEMHCIFCGSVSPAGSHCTQMHYVCDECSTISSVEIVKSFCLKSKKTDPISLAVEIMRSPAIKMHGPEHHFLVPAVLFTCINNKYHTIDNLEEKIELARSIAHERVPICSLDLKMCGAAIGTGVFLELYTNLDTRLEDEWSLPNQMIAKSLKRIGEIEGPRCCKRDCYISLQEAVDFLYEKYAIELPKSEAKCTFSLRNNSCLRDDCQFYNIGYSIA